MKILTSCILCVAASTLAYGLTFQGLTELGITKNSFLCSDSSAVACSNADAGAIGCELMGSQPLQFFDNQLYWLQQKANRAEIVQTDLRYTGSALENKLNAEGWGQMGAYCIIVSVDPVLVDVVMPNVEVNANQIKLVAQLWYNGGNLIQLWSQDAVAIDKTKSFKISITSDLDAQISRWFTSASSKSFVGQIGLQANNRQAEYAQANGSPRCVKIVVSA